MPTKSKIISDIELILLGSKPSDDDELERDHIGDKVDEIADDLSSKYLNDYFKKNGMLDPAYIEKAGDCLDLQLEDSDCNPDCPRLFATLPCDVLSLKGDVGIRLVQTSKGKKIDKISVFDTETVKHLWFSAASQDNILYYREGRTIYFLGIPETSLNHVKINVFMVCAQTGNPNNEEGDYMINPELLSDLKDLAVAKLAPMMGVEVDLDNDGQQGGVNGNR